MEPASPALAGRFFITEPPGKPQVALDTDKYPCLGRWVGVQLTLPPPENHDYIQSYNLKEVSEL